MIFKMILIFIFFDLKIIPPNLNVAPTNKKQGFQHSPCSSKTPGEVIYIG